MYKKALVLAGAAALAAAPAFAAGTGSSMSTDTTARTQAATSNTAGGTATTQDQTNVTGRTAAEAATGSGSASGTMNATTATPAPDAATDTTGRTKSTLSGTSAGTTGSATATTMAKPKMSGEKMHAPDAQMHYREVAMGNVKEIMAQYSPKATLKWEGGRLNGTYHGKEEIEKVWKKFSATMGQSTVASHDVKVKGNMKHMTVMADVSFHGHMTVPVKSTLVYRDKKIVEEIWKVEPQAHAKK